MTSQQQVGQHHKEETRRFFYPKKRIENRDDGESDDGNIPRNYEKVTHECSDMVHVI